MCSSSQVDGDGDVDLLLANTGANELVLNFGDGSFGASVALPGSANTTWSLAVGDLNGDGHVDVLLGNMGGVANELLLGGGDGTFTVSQILAGSLDATRGVAIGDLDGDGDLDALACDLLINRGNGIFQAVSGFSSLSIVCDTMTAMAFGDVRPTARPPTPMRIRPFFNLACPLMFRSVLPFLSVPPGRW